MYQRGRNWIARILCAVAALVVTAPAAAWAASEGGLISFDKSLIMQGINFVLLLFVLHRILYKPLVAKMEERTAAIQKSLEEAQPARAEAARQQEENAARLRSAYQEAASIREQALKEAAEEQRKLVEAAQAEARRLVEGARAQTEADIRRAREELRREVADARRRRRREARPQALRDEDHRRIIDDAIADSIEGRMRHREAVAKSLREGAASSSRGSATRSTWSARSSRRSGPSMAQQPALRAVPVAPWVAAPAPSAPPPRRSPAGSTSRRSRATSSRSSPRAIAPTISPRSPPRIARLDDEAQGRVRVKLRTAVALTDAEREQLSARLARMLGGKKLVIEETVDRSCWAASSPRSAA